MVQDEDGLHDRGDAVGRKRRRLNGVHTLPGVRW